jgi:hypothetical protein
MRTEKNRDLRVFSFCILTSLVCLKALREFREYFSFVFNSFLCVCKLECIGAFGFE